MMTLQKSKWLNLGIFFFFSSVTDFLNVFPLPSIRYDSNASASESDSGEDGDDSDDTKKKKKEKKEKTVKVVKEKKERKPRKEVREHLGQEEKHERKKMSSINPLTLPSLFHASRGRGGRRRSARPRGRWAPTCCGSTPAERESSLRTPASPSQRSPRRPERCGGRWAKRTRRWGRILRKGGGGREEFSSPPLFSNP